MLEKAPQRMRITIMMTIPVAVLLKTLKRVPAEVVIQELQVAAPVAEVQAAVPVVEVNLAEAVLVAAVPVAEVNLAEAALVAENLPVVKVQNNV